MNEDPLSAARGCLSAAALATIFWLAIFWGAFAWLS